MKNFLRWQVKILGRSIPIVVILLAIVAFGVAAAFISTLSFDTSLSTGSPGPIVFSGDALVTAINPSGANGVSCSVDAGGLDGDTSITVSGAGHYPSSGCQVASNMRVDGDFDLYIQALVDTSPPEVDLVTNGNFWNGGSFPKLILAGGGMGDTNVKFLVNDLADSGSSYGPWTMEVVGDISP